MMGNVSRTGRVMAILLGSFVLVSGVFAQGQPAQASAAHKSVRGKLASVDLQLNGVIMTTDEGKRVAWKFDKVVIERLSAFKPGDPVIVIYRQGAAGKMVTAIAFPGTAVKPIYVNTSGERVELVGGPIVNGACGQPSETPLTTTTIPTGAQVELADACWCCAPAGETCIPANKTGAGQAFLAHCPR
jgi:hypothetical protein